MRTSQQYNSFLDCIFLLQVIECDGKMFNLHFSLCENFDYKPYKPFLIFASLAIKYMYTVIGYCVFVCLYKLSIMTGSHNTSLNVLLETKK